MNLIEYYEAISRVADEACLSPGSGLYENTETMIIQERQEFPLEYKIEGLIIRFLEKCCDKNFTNNYPKIEKSMFAVESESEYEEIVWFFIINQLN